MSPVVDPGPIAARYLGEVRARVAALDAPLTLVGFLSSTSAPSLKFASYTEQACQRVGIRFDRRVMPRLQLERAICEANGDPAVHGMMIYYPVFGTQQDSYLKELVEPRKDVEGLTTFWVRKLYANDRMAVPGDPSKKAILPCTALAIMKIIDALGLPGDIRSRPLEGLAATVFNRSEVVGRPLAAMLANDGAEVTSFDIDGPVQYADGEVRETDQTRASALAAADIVVTGVPSRAFAPVRAAELKPGATCINFSTLRNFAADVEEVAAHFVPRVGPVTVAMCLRNTLRLYDSFQR